MSLNKEMPKGWATVKLLNVCDKITDGSHFSPESVDIGYPYVTVKDLKNDTVDFSKCLKISKKDYEILLKNDCNPLKNDVLFSKDGTVGKVTLVNYDLQFVVLSSLAILRPQPDTIFSKYLFYVLKSSQFLLQALNQKKGVAIRRIILRDLKEIYLNLPPLPEQQRIVAKIEELFSSLDKGIENLKIAQQQLKVYRLAVLKWAFEGKLTSKNIKEGELPKGWRRDVVKNIALSIQYGYTESSSKEKIGPKFLRITDIQDYRVNWDDVPYCIIDNEEKQKYLLEDGDLVFARTGATVGKSFLIKGEIPESIFASYLIRLRFPKQVNDKYVWYYFQSPFYWSQIVDKQVGIGQPNVNGTKLGRLEIIIPRTLEEQKLIVAEIESRLSVCDKIEESIEQSLKQSESLRQSILKKTFDGKLVPQDPNDKPANILLERIQATRTLRQVQDKRKPLKKIRTKKEKS
jgi:type I restriction enzyme S subunit